MVRGQKMALLVLLKGRLVGGAKPNVPFVRWQFKIFCAVEKKLKHRRVGNECRLTPCPFVVSFLCLCSPVKMVYFFCFSVRYFLSGRCLLRLHTTFCSLAKWRKSEHKSSILHKGSIEELNLNLALNPPFCQTAVSGCLFIFVSVCYFKFHHNVGLFVISKFENMFVKLYETIFLIKIYCSLIFFPNA